MEPFNSLTLKTKRFHLEIVSIEKMKEIIN